MNRRKASYFAALTVGAALGTLHGKFTGHSTWSLPALIAVLFLAEWAIERFDQSQRGDG